MGIEFLNAAFDGADASAVTGYEQDALAVTFEDPAPPAPPPSPTPPTVAVGGEAYPVNKVGLIAPWVALAMVISAGGLYLMRRRVSN
jgi:hypothetical protein